MGVSGEVMTTIPLASGTGEKKSDTTSADEATAVSPVTMINDQVISPKMSLADIAGPVLRAEPSHPLKSDKTQGGATSPRPAETLTRIADGNKESDSKVEFQKYKIADLISLFKEKFPKLTTEAQALENILASSPTDSKLEAIQGLVTEKFPLAFHMIYRTGRRLVASAAAAAVTVSVGPIAAAAAALTTMIALSKGEQLTSERNKSAFKNLLEIDKQREEAHDTKTKLTDTINAYLKEVYESASTNSGSKLPFESWLASLSADELKTIQNSLSEILDGVGSAAQKMAESKRQLSEIKFELSRPFEPEINRTGLNPTLQNSPTIQSTSLN